MRVRTYTSVRVNAEWIRLAHGAAAANGNSKAEALVVLANGCQFVTVHDRVLVQELLTVAEFFAGEKSRGLAKNQTVMARRLIDNCRKFLSDE